MIISGQMFFSSAPNGVFNLLSSFTELKEFVQLHEVMQSNKQCSTHWEGNLRQYAHRTEPLFVEFTSAEALRWVLFVGNIDARGWELCLTRFGEKAPHSYSFFQVCKDSDLDIVKAVAERTQVDMEARDRDGDTPLHLAARGGHLPVAQYLCE